MERIGKFKPEPGPRSEYAAVLLRMGIDESIRVFSKQRLNAYRVTARRYGISIRTAKRGASVILWVVGNPRWENRAVRPKETPWR